MLAVIGLVLLFGAFAAYKKASLIRTTPIVIETWEDERWGAHKAAIEVLFCYAGSASLALLGGCLIIIAGLH